MFQKNSHIILGDIHGDFHIIQDLIDSHHTECQGIIQVGDFGYGMDAKSSKDLFELKVPLPFTVSFIDGNHDNCSLLYSDDLVLPEGVRHIRRGSIQTINDSVVLFIGGAGSPDRNKRTEGKDWWKCEIPTHQEQNNILITIETYQQTHNKKIDYVITHDCPDFVDIGLNLLKDTYCLEMRKFLTEVYQLIKPIKWFYGHYHQTKEFIYEDTLFQCIATADVVYQKF